MTAPRIHHLNCGTMCPRLARGLEMVCHCLLVETERDGLVLVDTGLGTGDLADGGRRLGRMFVGLVGPRLDPAEPAIARVRALGFAPEDVRHIVVTHLDLDHAGGIADFPSARVHLHAREHAAAMARSLRRERQRYLPAHWAHGPSWEVYAEDGDTWRGLPAVRRLRGLDADIGLLPMHGHTRGHSAVVVRAGERWLVHAGDAYFHRSSVEGAGSVPFGLAAFERMVQIDGPRRRASAAALRQLRERYDDIDLFCAHDPDEFEAIRAS